MTPQESKPVPPVRENQLPPMGIAHKVAAGKPESWVSLATLQGLSDPWDLIDFNFPGMKLLHQINPPLAARQVNWYLREYVGCETSLDGGNNWAFTFPLTGGKGVWKGGVIYLPPPKSTPTPTPPPAAPPCVIQIGSLVLSPAVLAILQLVKVRLPTQARCLDPTEVAYARNFYSDSLAYEDIYVSDGHGADNRPVTIALPTDSRWIVVLNMGPTDFRSPLSHKDVLIHELAHAWQSQHHPEEPMKFMWNCSMSQVEAATLTAVAAAYSNRWSRLGLDGLGLPDPNLGEADAYAYIPGKPHRDYGGEQIAQQVEDSVFYPTRLNRGVDLASAQAILNRMKNVPRGARDSENVSSLSSTKVALKDSPGVVWHDQWGLPVYP